jgi:ribosome-associated protein
MSPEPPEASPPPPAEALALPGGVTLDRSRLSFRASRSGGPGGQNVNKRSTKADVRVPLEALPYDEATRDRLRQRLASRIVDDELVATASTERHQLANRQAAEARLVELIADALDEDPERVPTRISRAVRQRRREDKARRAARKRDRRFGPPVE